MIPYYYTLSRSSVLSIALDWHSLPRMNLWFFHSWAHDNYSYTHSMNEHTNILNDTKCRLSITVFHSRSDDDCDRKKAFARVNGI